MPDSALAARIDAAVDANFDAEIAFLQELVRCPSLRGQEASAASSGWRKSTVKKT